MTNDIQSYGSDTVIIIPTADVRTLVESMIKNYLRSKGMPSSLAASLILHERNQTLGSIVTDVILSTIMDIKDSGYSAQAVIHKGAHMKAVAKLSDMIIDLLNEFRGYETDYMEVKEFIAMLEFEIEDSVIKAFNGCSVFPTAANFIRADRVNYSNPNTDICVTMRV